ncbi:unnamed protein product [Prorocentrum cordatum]|uniref:Uncharacterized protein n=1 Tax=Prorocentrum cordatum TaxID=2364126 RepID=A0ABN9PRB4_9DINO|nr:unnamed protein product [Polarella glacialis]
MLPHDMGVDSAAETIDGTPHGVAAVSPTTSFLSMGKSTWNDLCVDLRFTNAVLFPKPAWGYIHNEPGHEVKQASGHLRAAPAAAKAWWHHLFGDSGKGDREPSSNSPSQMMKKKKKQQRSASQRAPTNPVDLDDLDAIIRETNEQPYFLDAPQRRQKNRHGRAGKKGRAATNDQVRESAAGIEGCAEARLDFGGASPERNPHRVTAAGGSARGCSDIERESGDASENVINFIPDALRQTERVFDAELSLSDMGTCLLNATAAADDAWASICPTWEVRAPLTVAYFNVLAHRVCTGRGQVSFPQLQFERRQRWSNLLRSGACRVCLEVSPVAGMSGHAFTVRFPRMTHEPEVEIVDDGNVNERIATTLTTFVQSVERTSARFFIIIYSSEIIHMDFGDPYSIEVAGDEDVEDEDAAPCDLPDESIQEAAAREEHIAESQVSRKRQQREGESTVDLLAAHDKSGLISEGVLAICRRSFLQVEGVFLQMHKWQPMADEAFVEQFKGMRSKLNMSDLDFLRHCEDSIHRRSWVVILKAKFLPPDLAAAIPNASNKGIFCKGPKLKDVLKSAPAALALWQILHGFMRKHTKDDSLQIIEDYAEVGGEDEKLAMRIAVAMLDNCIDSVTVEEFSNKLGVGLVTASNIFVALVC